MGTIEPFSGGINRGRWLIFSCEAVHQLEVGEIRFDGFVYLVAVECDDDNGVAGRRCEGGAIDFEVALVDGLAERNASEGNDLRVEGCVHEHGRAWIADEQRLESRRNGIVVRLARVGVLGAFNVDDGIGAQERKNVEASESKEEREGKFGKKERDGRELGCG